MTDHIAKMAAAAVALTLGATAATQSVAGPTAEEITAAKAEGDRILAAAGATDLFENRTGGRDTTLIVLVHKASGLECQMNAGKSLTKVVVYANPVRGDDISCTNETVDNVYTLYATRSRGQHLDGELEIAKKAIQSRFPDAKPWPGGDGPARSTWPDSRRARFIAGGEYTSVTIDQAGDWIVKMRLNAHVNHGARQAGMSEPLFWDGVMDRMTGKRPPWPD